MNPLLFRLHEEEADATTYCWRCRQSALNEYPRRRIGRRLRSPGGRSLRNLVFTRGDGRPIHRADWSYIWRPAVEKAGLPRASVCGTCGTTRDRADLWRANVKTVQLAMGHTTPTVTLNTYVGYWPDAVDQTRTLVDTALGCTRSVPA